MRHFWINQSPLWFFRIGLLLCWLQLAAGLPINSPSPNLPFSPKKTNQIPGNWNSEFSQALKPLEPAVEWFGGTAFPLFPRALSELPFPLPVLQGLISSWPVVGIPRCSTMAKEFTIFTFFFFSFFPLLNCLGDYHKLNTNLFTGWTKFLVFFARPEEALLCLKAHHFFSQALLPGCVKGINCLSKSCPIIFFSLTIPSASSGPSVNFCPPFSLSWAGWSLLTDFIRPAKLLFWNLQKFHHWLIIHGLKLCFLNMAFEDHK